MRLCRAVAGLLIVLSVGATMPHTFAQSTVTPQRPGDPDYEQLHAAATAPLRDALGGAVVLDVERLDRLGRWAFLMGTMRTPGGERPDYAGTPYAQRAASGGMSDLYVALLRAGPDNANPPAVDADDAETSATGFGQQGQGHAQRDHEGHATTDWTVLDYAIGPADVTWLAWPERHAAPRHLFGF